MILEVTGDEVAQLDDTQLRMLVAYLCECELRANGHSPSHVTWGGHQNAPDGGIDVRVELPKGASISGYVPNAATGFQVKAEDMPRKAILKEMAPGGVVRSSIAGLATQSGAYVIVSSQGSTSDDVLKRRRAAMGEAAKLLPAGSSLALDFYDRRRLASWVNQNAGLIPWVRERLGLPLRGWRPFQDWSSSPAPIEAEYLIDKQLRLVGPSIQQPDGLSVEDALSLLRGILSKAKGIVRLVGLSGVGKTRLLQAMFDDRIGAGALLKAEALYADVSDSPDPVPQEMLSWLISMNQRVILVVDNCGIELHKKLAARVASSNCLLSAITVEYDITDDEPPYTETFKWEPASGELIERILEAHYPNIEPPSRQVIAQFAEGNSRVAFALADTAKSGESLANFKDSDLFERLFYQQQAHNTELLDGAKVCALLYSFDGETLAGDESELTPLANLAGQSVDLLYKHIAELQRRQLVQKRGKWRAILPHALANRLAKRALDDIPPQRIENAIVMGPSTRMLRSFSRRIGYLHEHDVANQLTAKWLQADGLLANLGRLDIGTIAIFENIAPVNPTRTLEFIEKTSSAGKSWFFGEQNKNKPTIVRVVRALSYDPALFERCARLLTQFALNEPSRSQDSAAHALRSLFTIYLSGTHATVAQRAAFVRALIESNVVAENTLGLSLLEEMLKTSNFASHYSFEFGARKRDYGLHPHNGAEVGDWYTEAIRVGLDTGISNTPLSDGVRHAMANHIAALMQAGMFDAVIALCKAFAQDCGWPEGWIGMRVGMRRGKGKIPAEIFQQFQELEKQIRPVDLTSMIRSHALSPEWGNLDIADIDENEDLEPIEARRRIHSVCVDLGEQLAADGVTFAAMLPEMVASSSDKTAFLGEGLATRCASVKECWIQLRQAFFAVPQGSRYGQMLAGFLASAFVRAPEEAESLLDEVLSDVRLHPYFVYWQISAGLQGRAFERLRKAIALDTVPVHGLRALSYGRTHRGLSDEQLHLLLVDMLSKADGNAIAVQILGMRVYGQVADKETITESLREISRDFLARVKIDRDVNDHLLGGVVVVAFDRPEHGDQARAFCAKLIDALARRKVGAWDLSEIITGLAKVFPTVVLDMFVDATGAEAGARLSELHEIRSNRIFPLDAIPRDVILAWAGHKPATRYALLARELSFSTRNAEDDTEAWSPVALSLIEAAPDPVKVLDTFLKRFRPSGWVGSLAHVLARRLPLLEALIHHSKPEVAAWANVRINEYKVYIDRQRADEAAEHRGLHEGFE